MTDFTITSPIFSNQSGSLLSPFKVRSAALNPKPGKVSMLTNGIIPKMIPITKVLMS